MFGSAKVERLSQLAALPSEAAARVTETATTADFIGNSYSSNGIASSSTSKPVQFTAIAFRWFTLARRFKVRHRPPLFGQLQPQFPARFGFTVERLRNRSRAADLAEEQYLHLEVTAVVFYLQHVARMDLARRLRWLSIRLNPTELTCPRRQRPRLEESGRPEPLVHSYASHRPILESPYE